MSYDFWIQASCPRWQGIVDPEATTVDEACESVFPRDTEDAIVVWQHVHIPLNYKYDVGTILRDILQMIQELSAAESGEWEVNWPSSTFGAHWHFKWEGDRLVVTALEWRWIVGGTEELLRQRPILEIGKQEFMSEWKALLEWVHTALWGAGYTIKMLPDLERLAATISQIQQYGRLYR